MEPALKQALLDYNRQDCEAIALLTERLADLHAAVPRTASRRTRRWFSHPT